METNLGTSRRRHVVIVDDNTGRASFFSEILRLVGYGVTVMTMLRKPVAVETLLAEVERAAR